MSEQKEQNTTAESSTNDNKDTLNENMHLFVYGNLKIIDKDTGQILVNKPF